jgi:hypothetical protein
VQQRYLSNAAHLAQNALQAPALPAH